MRIFYSPDRRHEISDLLKWAASARVLYREVPREELSKIAKTDHHEGLVIHGIPLPHYASAESFFTETLNRQQPSRGGFYFLLDGVENAHNIGAVVRSAAFFGAAGVIASQPTYSASISRVAEGGLELVPYFQLPTESYTDAISRLVSSATSQGLTLYGASSKKEAKSVDMSQLVSGHFKMPCIVALGSERDGLCSTVQGACEKSGGLFRISQGLTARGFVDSLNVSATASILASALAVAKSKT
jgi:TrmH RNA methyltransferase